MNKTNAHVTHIYYLGTSSQVPKLTCESKRRRVIYGILSTQLNCKFLKNKLIKSCPQINLRL